MNWRQLVTGGVAAIALAGCTSEVERLAKKEFYRDNIVVRLGENSIRLSDLNIIANNPQVTFEEFVKIKNLEMKEGLVAGYYLDRLERVYPITSETFESFKAEFDQDIKIPVTPEKAAAGATR